MIARLGVLSDTHGRVASCRRAVAALRAADVDALVHLGDVDSEGVLEELVGEPPAHVVFGNCDDERRLGRHADRLGIHVAHPVGELRLAGRRVAFTHGHLSDAVRTAIGRHDLLLVGHSHRLGDERRDGTRVVNPGALFRAARYTCCVVEGPDLRVSWIDVGREPDG